MMCGKQWRLEKLEIAIFWSCTWGRFLFMIYRPLHWLSEVCAIYPFKRIGFGERKGLDDYRRSGFSYTLVFFSSHDERIFLDT